MRTLIISAIIFIILSQIKGLAQSTGFLETECGIVSNQAYYYENYYFTGHGGGCRLYHNGNIIFDPSDIFTPISGRELKFMDDTTGYFIVFAGPAWSMDVKRISNNSVVSMGFCSGDLFNSFVVSRHTMYVTSYIGNSSYNWLFITRFSDLASQKTILSTQYILPDSTFHDTVYGIPLCQNLGALHYLYGNFPDTIVYTIQFNTDTLESVPLHRETGWIISPNPASDIIHIQSQGNEQVRHVTILDNLGREREQVNVENTRGWKIDIKNLARGYYFLRVENERIKKIFKIVKI